RVDHTDRVAVGPDWLPTPTLDAARRRRQRRRSPWADRQMTREFPELRSAIPYDTSGVYRMSKRLPAGVWVVHTGHGQTGPNALEHAGCIAARPHSLELAVGLFIQ